MNAFASQPEALTWIFFFGFWLVLVFMSLNMRGSSGNRIGAVAILQFIFGLVISLHFWSFSGVVSIGVLMVATVIMIGILMDGRTS